MAILVIVLRAMHILGGIFWAGGMILMHGFVLPSAEATRPDSGRFMQYLTGKRNLPLWMTLASWATVIGGLGLFAPVTGQLDSAVLRTPRGMTISLGALLALAAFLEGNIVTAPNARKLGAIGREIAASGQGPTPEQLQRMQVVQGKMQRTGVRGTVMVALASVLMAVARYI